MRIVTGFSSDLVGILFSKLQCHVFGRGLCYLFMDIPLLKYRFCSRWMCRVTLWGFARSNICDCWPHITSVYEISWRCCVSHLASSRVQHAVSNCCANFKIRSWRCLWSRNTYAGVHETRWIGSKFENRITGTDSMLVSLLYFCSQEMKLGALANWKAHRLSWRFSPQ